MPVILLDLSTRVTIKRGDIGIVKFWLKRLLVLYKMEHNIVLATIETVQKALEQKRRELRPPDAEDSKEQALSLKRLSELRHSLNQVVDWVMQAVEKKMKTDP